MIVIGVGAAVKFLPFAFTLGVSRRTYYLGTVALVVGLCAVYSVFLTGLWWLEQLTDGWGIQMHFFQVPWVLWGPWYQVLITNFVLLSLMFLIGMLFGLIYRRFALVGTLIFSGAVTLVIVAAALLVTWQQWWPRVGDFLTDGEPRSAAADCWPSSPCSSRLGGYGDHPSNHRLTLPSRPESAPDTPVAATRDRRIAATGHVGPERDQAGPGTLNGSLAPAPWAARAVK